MTENGCSPQSHPRSQAAPPAIKELLFKTVPCTEKTGCPHLQKEPPFEEGRAQGILPPGTLTLFLSDPPLGKALDKSFPDLCRNKVQRR